MKVFVPFTRLRPHTYAAIPWATFVPLLDRQYGYGEYFKQRWDEGESFINVEQDVVVSPATIADMLACGSEICFAPYTYPGQPDRIEHGTYLGCVKISKEFIERTLGLFDKQPMDWQAPEALIWSAQKQKPCYHDAVLHLHVDSNWPEAEKIKYGA